MFCKNLTRSCLVLIATVLLYVPSASATLIGTNVDGCLNYVGSGGCSPFTQGTWDNASATIADSAIEFTGNYFSADASADFDANSLTFGLVLPPLTNASALDREVSFKFMNGPVITGFSQTGGILIPSYFSFTADSITFGFNDLEIQSVNNPSQAIFAIETAPVPEPSTALLFGLGLVGLGVYRRKVAIS